MHRDADLSRYDRSQLIAIIGRVRNKLTTLGINWRSLERDLDNPGGLAGPRVTDMRHGK